MFFQIIRLACTASLIEETLYLRHNTVSICLLNFLALNSLQSALLRAALLFIFDFLFLVDVLLNKSLMHVGSDCRLLISIIRCLYVLTL